MNYFVNTIYVYIHFSKTLICIKTFQLETIRMLPSASILNYTTLADVTNSWKIVDCNGNAIGMLQTVGILLEYYKLLGDYWNFLNCWKTIGILECYKLLEDFWNLKTVRKLSECHKLLEDYWNFRSCWKTIGKLQIERILVEY